MKANKLKLPNKENPNKYSTETADERTSESHSRWHRGRVYNMERFFFQLSSRWTKRKTNRVLELQKLFLGKGQNQKVERSFHYLNFFFKSQTIFLSFRLKISSGGTRVKRLFRVGVFIQRKISFGKKYNKKNSDCGSNAYVREQFSGHVAERKLGEEDWWRRGGGEQMDRNGSWPTLCIFIFSYFYKSFESSSWWPWHQRAIDCQSKRQDSEPNGWKKTKLCFVSFVLKSCCAFLLLPQTVFFYLQQRGTAEQKNLRKWREKEIFFFLRMNEERDGGWRRTRWNYHSE